MRLRETVLSITGYWLLSGHLAAATLCGQEVRTGPEIEIRFPVSKYYQDIAAWAGNPRPQTGRAVLTFPPGFDPSRPWPIFIVTASTTTDRVSPDDVFAYHPCADKEGWVVLATDATIKPKHDSTPWRLAMLGAGLEAIRKEWPQTKDWPVALGGFCGGGRRSGLIAAMFAKAHAVNLCGLYFTGMDKDVLSDAYQTYRPDPSFLHTPIWMSAGDNDIIATGYREGNVAASIKRSGFDRVRLEYFMGKHGVKRAEVRLAMRWFRQLGGF